MKPTPADITIIENAAAIIDGEAHALRQSTTVPPQFIDWNGCAASKALHDRWLKAVADLYALAARMGA